ARRARRLGRRRGLGPRGRRAGRVARRLLRALCGRGLDRRRERREASPRTRGRRGPGTARPLPRDDRGPLAGGRRGGRRGRARGPGRVGAPGYRRLRLRPDLRPRGGEPHGRGARRRLEGREQPSRQGCARAGRTVRRAHGNGVDSAPMLFSSDTKVELLRKAPLFADLSKPELEHLAKSTEDLEVEAGRVLCREGEVASEFFVIIEGEAEATKDG